MAINKGYLTAATDKASDETYTPAYAVRPIIKYLDRGNKPQYTIWCPFDEEDSNYVIELKQAGFKVIATHIKNGQNFFDYEPEEFYDFIVSNPPFSIKDDILKRLNELGKPFAMLLPLPTLQGQKRFEYLKDCQALIFDKRINFYKNKETKEIQKGVAFASIYICKDILPQDLIFETLEVE
ncbi:MAG: tRNA (adenine-N(6)-)-methyltransferase [Bacilli bacterium]|nr:tRNA (adenine-N(6)-)-methyltransferase [Bacilli bacterium]